MTHSMLAPTSFVLLSALSLSGCGHKAVEEVATDEDVPVAVQPVAVVDTFEATVSATGLVTPASGADWWIVAPEVARIAELPKAEGDRVQPGDLLVRFDIPTMTADLASREADVAQAKTHVDTAKANHDRLAGLVDRGVAAQKDLEDATLELAQANAGLLQAEAARTSAATIGERATVKARFAGVVAQRLHGVGDLVDANGQVMRVIDPNRLEVLASIPVAALARVAVGRDARIENPAGDGFEAGVVASVPAAVDPSSATASIRVRFSSHTTLATGTPVAVTIVAEHLSKVLVVPTAGIVRDGGEVYVMVAGQDDDKAHKTPVTLGLAAGDKTVVKSGVRAGDLIIVRGQIGLPDEAGIVIAK
jgi:RND family efflux transporter MFP subunit